MVRRGAALLPLAAKRGRNWIYDLLTPATAARNVQVVAHDPKLLSLEKAKVLYLGAHGGTDVLYDRTAKHTVLVPAGNVTLILPPR